MLLSNLLAISLAVPSVLGFFRMPCSQPVVVERADSIVTPAKVSGHVHSVLGGNGFGLSQTFAQARNSTCSTCMARDDLSNYWMPAIYYRRKDGKFEKVPQLGGATIYYLQRRANASEKLVAFPDNFQLLAGSPTLRSYNASRLDQQAISWVCLDYKGSGAGGEYKHFPDHHCPNGVRQQVFFPSCWNGKDTDSSDHKSHMAYPDRMDAGKCPSTHPVRTISLFYEIIWDTAIFQFWKPSGANQPFVTASGDPTGYGGHADFFNGWDKSALQRAIDGCNQESGVIEDCSNVLRLRSNDEMNACSLDTHINERVTGVLDTLPGCNPVTNGPGVAAMPSTCALSGDAAAHLIMEPGKSLFMKYDIAGWKPVGCAMDSLGSRTLQHSTASDDMTVEKCTGYCKSKSYKYSGMEYGRECWCGNTLDKSKLGTYRCDQPCSGNSLEYCGNAGRLSVYEAGNYVPPTSTPKPTSTSTPKPTSTSTPRPAQPTTTTTPPGKLPLSTAPKGFTSVGCFVDSVASRNLKGSSLVSKSMTASLCTAHCTSKGFRFSGIEYGKECFCGNSVTAARAPMNDCTTMACAGNSKVSCGAGNRIQIFQKNAGKRELHSRRLSSH